MPAFIPGQRLGQLFYDEVVRPLLAAEYPALTHSAALIGYGSDVLGYDTPRSTDHQWGPRLQLFLGAADHAAHRAAIVELLRQRLPTTFRGYSTHFGPAGEDGARVAATRASGPVDHLIEVVTTPGFFQRRLGLDPTAALRPADWLALPEQRLLEMTAGQVYHDGLGELTPLRARLAYYPRDVWFYRLAAQWRRVEQQEPFVGRTAEVGDDLGSRLVTADLVEDLMRLGFLMERRYAPYSKWFGTAFARLDCAPTLGPLLSEALQAATWPAREAALTGAYRLLAERHNALGITPPLPTEVSSFHGRPFLVLHADRFTRALLAAIADPAVRAIPGLCGAVDQLSDSTDLLSYAALYRRLTVLYE